MQKNPQEILTPYTPVAGAGAAAAAAAAVAASATCLPYHSLCA